MNRQTKLLVPVDFSEASLEAMDMAVTLAMKNDAEVLLLAVVEPQSGAGSQTFLDRPKVEEELKRLFDSRLEARTEAAESFFQDVSIFVREGKPAETILEIAKEEGVQMIVMGTHGREGLARAVLGSVTEEVVRRAACPVLTLRARASHCAWAGRSGSASVEAKRSWMKGQ